MLCVIACLSVLLTVRSQREMARDGHRQRPQHRACQRRAGTGLRTLSALRPCQLSALGSLLKHRLPHCCPLQGRRPARPWASRTRSSKSASFPKGRQHLASWCRTRKSTAIRWRLQSPSLLDPMMASQLLVMDNIFKMHVPRLRLLLIFAALHSSGCMFASVNKLSVHSRLFISLALVAFWKSFTC